MRVGSREWRQWDSESQGARLLAESQEKSLDGQSAGIHRDTIYVVMIMEQREKEMT